MLFFFAFIKMKLDMQFDVFMLYRFIFLVFIVMIAVYFVIDNKKTVEKFEEKLPSKATPPQKEPVPVIGMPPGVQEEAVTSANAAKVINDIFNELYKHPPAKEELVFFVDFVKNRKSISKQKLKDVIESSAPTLSKTLYTKKKADTPDEILGNENEIIQVFNEILLRNPDKGELSSLSREMHADKTFTLDKLKQTLIASEEFKRLEKTQSNKVYMNLQSNVTDRQITMQVMEIYKEVTGKDYVDEDTLRFLKKKFVQFELSPVKMTKFIQAYLTDAPYVEPQATYKAINPEELKKQNAAMDAKMEQMKQKMDAEFKAKMEALKKEEAKKANNKETYVQKGSVAAPADGKYVYNDSTVYNFFGDQQANEDIIGELKKTGFKGGDADGVNTSSMISNIKASCPFSKNAAEDELLAKNKQHLADYVNSRNTNELQSICSRNKKFINADENMVLRPDQKWSVPQPRPPVCLGGNQGVSPMNDQTALIGTLLDDAKNTSVGSVTHLYPPV
jgi:hypothetical protein